MLDLTRRARAQQRFTQSLRNPLRLRHQFRVLAQPRNQFSSRIRGDRGQVQQSNILLLRTVCPLSYNDGKRRPQRIILELEGFSAYIGDSCVGRLDPTGFGGADRTVNWFNAVCLLESSAKLVKGFHCGSLCGDCFDVR